MSVEFVEFITRLGYRYNLNVSREEMDVTVFGDLAKTYVLGHLYELTVYREGETYEAQGRNREEVEAKVMRMLLS